MYKQYTVTLANQKFANQTPHWILMDYFSGIFIVLASKDLGDKKTTLEVKLELLFSW